MDKRVWFLDLDGTLLDTPRVFYSAMVKLGRKETWEEVRSKLSGKDWGTWVNTLPNEDLCRLVTDALSNGTDYATPGARGFLERCRAKGEMCFLLTHTPAQELSIRLRSQGMDRYFQGIGCLPNVGKEDLIRLVLQSHRFSPERCAMVGDTIMDVIAGKKAGIKAYGVTFGAALESELVGVGGIPIRSFDQL